MQDNIFIDTNIWIYFFAKSNRTQDIEKREKAEALILNSNKIAVSAQIVNEVCNVLIKKFRFTPDSLMKIISEVSNIAAVHPLFYEHTNEALRLIKKYSMSFFDALVVASAFAAGCSVMYSEDMQHGLKVHGNLEIINPFL